MSPPGGTTGKRRAVSTKVLPKPVGDGEEPSALWFLAPLLMRAGPTGPDKTWLIGCKLPASERIQSRGAFTPVPFKQSSDLPKDAGRSLRFKSTRCRTCGAADYNTGHCG